MLQAILLSYTSFNTQVQYLFKVNIHGVFSQESSELSLRYHLMLAVKQIVGPVHFTKI